MDLLNDFKTPESEKPAETNKTAASSKALAFSFLSKAMKYSAIVSFLFQLLKYIAIIKILFFI